MKRLMKFLTICTPLILAACAGTNFKWDQARQIKPGMSDTELVKLMGPPYMVRVGANGEQLYQWVYADLYGISGGTRVLNVSLKENKVVTAPVIPDAFK